MIVYKYFREELERTSIVRNAENNSNKLRIKMNNLNNVIRKEANNPQPSNSNIAAALDGIDDVFNEIVQDLKKFIRVFDERVKRPELTDRIRAELNGIVLLKYR
jgi:hypothetical protein